MPVRKKAPPLEPAGKASGPAATVVLVAVTGLSPAVLTETVWALSRETPPLIPDLVVCVTTEAGRRAIAAQLFGTDEVWQQLRQAILGANHAADPRLDFDCTPDRVHVVHRREGSRRVALEGIASLADNTAIADALVDELWIHTSKPDSRVVASLAGGFKTMSALLLSAMQLLGNPGDRVTHVLVGGGFDHPQAGFFFPHQRRQQLAGPAGRLYARRAAGHLRLIDVPFIPLRRWFEDLLQAKPPSYDRLVHASAESMRVAEQADLRLELGPLTLPAARSRHWIRVNGAELAPSRDHYAYLRFFASRLRSGSTPLADPEAAVHALAEWLAEISLREPRFMQMCENVESTAFTSGSLIRRLSDLRTWLRRSGGAASRLAQLLPGKGNWSLRMRADSILLHD